MADSVQREDETGYVCVCTDWNEHTFGAQNNGLTGEIDVRMRGKYKLKIRLNSMSTRRASSLCLVSVLALFKPNKLHLFCLSTNYFKSLTMF